MNEDDYANAKKLTKALAKGWQGSEIVGDTKVAKVSIIGIGMISTPGVAAKMFAALGKAKVNIQMISTSEIKVSCIIPAKDIKKAVKTIHQEFELHK